MNPNTILISIVLGVLSIVLTILGGSWFNVHQFDKRMEELKEGINHRFDGLNVRFAAIEQRLDRIERQLEAIFKPTLPR